MSYEVNCKLMEVQSEQSGEGKNGRWVKQTFIGETMDQYPKKIAFTAFGEQVINQLKSIAVGSTVKVNFRVESREYNGRWYTDVRAFGISSMSAPASAPMQSQGQSFSEDVLTSTMDGLTQTGSDDLPF
ncbi:MAG: DUF3127 domain-containing protein [Bacteroidota bacterium]